jgi:hypothetical protein
MGAVITHLCASPPSPLPKRETQMQRECKCFQMKCVSESQLSMKRMPFAGSAKLVKHLGLIHAGKYLLSNNIDQDKTNVPALFILPCFMSAFQGCCYLSLSNLVA